MATVVRSVRIDEALHEEATKVFEEYGMPFSVGINIYLTWVANHHKLPFNFMDEPNPIKEEQP